MIDMVKFAPTSVAVGPPLPRATSLQWPWSQHPGELAAEMINALVGHTINDISYDQMNRIVHRLAGMRTDERKSPLRVADVVAQEIGPEKALKYVEIALKNGLITAHDYDIMRSALILSIPKENLPPGKSAGGLARELIEGQKALRRQFEQLEKPGRSEVLKPMSELDRQVQKFKKQIGM